MTQANGPLVGAAAKAMGAQTIGLLRFP